MQLDSTFVIARIIGPVFVLVGVALISQPSYMISAVGDVVTIGGLMVISGIVSALAGLTIVTLHRRWSGFTAALVSLIGWLLFARGAVTLVAPNLAHDAGTFILTHANFVPIAGCGAALVGLWLTYAGYVAGIFRVER
ncbi:MAG: hypothetical protein QM759_13080 [Terricaulis sp.]